MKSDADDEFVPRDATGWNIVSYQCLLLFSTGGMRKITTVKTRPPNYQEEFPHLCFQNSLRIIFYQILTSNENDFISDESKTVGQIYNLRSHLKENGPGIPWNGATGGKKPSADMVSRLLFASKVSVKELKNKAQSKLWTRSGFCRAGESLCAS